jgi:polyhydroxybutyrate depolymerase
MKKILCLTACIRNSGLSGKSKVSAFNKIQCQPESEVLFNPLLLIHANRCVQYYIGEKDMKLFMYFLLLLILFILSCKNVISPEIEKGLLTNQVITIEGVDRYYHLFVPNNPLNAPVVFLFHGNGGSFDDMLGLTGVKAPYKVWLDIANQENLIIIVPNGTLSSLDTRGWNDCRNDAPRTPTVNDVQFIVDLLDFIKEKYNSDDSRVFAVGTSNGGHFANRLAREIPDRITAFASIVASSAVNSVCSDSTEPVSALFMNGTGDPIMPYDGGDTGNGVVFSTESTVSYWVQRNATDTIPVVTNFPDINTNDSSTVTRYLYENGENGTEVVLYKVNNGGHTEPSISEHYSSIWLWIVGNQNGDIEMANEVWNFFKTKTR